ncbi:putative DENN domain-containing protein 2 [Paratrimastix pyriformis]|uniref:DENN domain-containing protein 2 n=1 Tax=Paratrimastix pyriformis TaxID=342808 RepID=A0ABQ8UEQ6_9EUKA|nr:putative DENN domain-containing protein 2 [Paratrimastix pyriformis]
MEEPKPPPFAEYVMIVGLNLDKPHISARQTKATLLDCKFTASILHQSPAERDPATIEVPPAIEAFTHPAAVKFQRFPEPPRYHAFVLTEAKGSHFYGHCLTVWEAVPRDVCVACWNNIRWPAKALPPPQSDLPDGGLDPSVLLLYLPRVLFVLTQYPAHVTIKQAMLSFSNGTVAAAASGDGICRPSFCPCAQRALPAAPTPTSALEDAYPHPHPVCVACAGSLFQALREVSLPPAAISALGTGSTNPARIAAPPGSALVRVGPFAFRCAFPSPRALPFVDIDFGVLFSRLDPPNIVTLVSVLLLEQHCLFISSDLHALSAATEASLALLYPMIWMHVYINVLPAALVDFFQAPMPFVIGCHRSVAESYPVPPEVVVIDLDRNRITVPPALTVPLLPERYRLRLIKIIQRHANLFPLSVADADSFQPGADTPDSHITQRTLDVLFSSSSELEPESLKQCIADEPHGFQGADPGLADPSGPHGSPPPPPTPSPLRPPPLAAPSPLPKAPITPADDGEDDFEDDDDPDGDGDEDPLPAAADEDDDGGDPAASALPVSHATPAAPRRVTGGPTAPMSPSKSPSTETTDAGWVLPAAVTHEKARVHVAALRRGFLSVLVSLLKYYRDFIVIPETASPSDASSPRPRPSTAPSEDLSLFRAESCLAEVRADCQEFLREFFRTQLFSCFISARVTRLDDDLFDAAIQKKVEMMRANIGILQQRSASGCLYKLGHLVKNWKRRRFKLTGLTLSYYPVTKDREMHSGRGILNSERSHGTVIGSGGASAGTAVAPKGKFTLIADLEMTKIEIPLERRRYPTSYPFQIRTVDPPRKLVMCAEDSQSRREWIKTLKAHLRLGKEAPSTDRIDQHSSVYRVVREDLNNRLLRTKLYQTQKIYETCRLLPVVGTPPKD